MALVPLSPPPPPPPKLVPLPLHVSKRLSVIKYLQTKPQPPPAWHRDEHPTYDPTYPKSYILSLLPQSSLKTLRLVSRDWYDWASKASPPLFASIRAEISPATFGTMQLRTLKGPSQECRHLFVAFHATALNIESPPSENAILPDFPNLTNLTIEYPDNGLNETQRRVLENPASQCRQLTITFPTHQTEPDAPQLADPKLPALPNMEHLHLICPTTNIFDRLLAFRDTLQKTEPLKLTHLALSHLTVNGISALRCGTFTSIGSSSAMARKIWHDLEALDIELIPWCDNMDPTPRRNRSKSEEQEWKTGLKMLHDWLHSFAIMSKLRQLKFSWRDTEGPDPLLLEDTAKQSKGGNWFSAPPVHWRALREVWLRNVRVSQSQVDDLKERIHGLQCLMVEERLADDRVLGWRRVVDGITWFEIQLADGVAELEGDSLHFHAQDLVSEELVNEIKGEGEENAEINSAEAKAAEVELEEITIQLDTMPVRGSRHGMIFSRGYSLEGP